MPDRSGKDQPGFGSSLTSCSSCCTAAPKSGQKSLAGNRRWYARLELYLIYVTAGNKGAARSILGGRGPQSG